MLDKKCEKENNKGFTLIELLIVIAIIGILSGIVVVSSSGAIEKSKRASALTTLASVLTEIVTCNDDDFGINAYDTSKLVCNDTGTPISHTIKWPDVSKTGWSVTAAVATNAQIATYTYSAAKGGQTNIVCDYASNSCN